MENIYKKIMNNKFIFFIFFYISTASEISQHYLGASFNIKQSKVTFIDKFNCVAKPHFEFKLSTAFKINSILLNGIKKDYKKTQLSDSKILYKINRNFWEPKDALITIEYQTNSDLLFQEINPNELIHFNSNDFFYPTGNEKSTKIEFHLKIPKNWTIICNDNITQLNNGQNSYKIVSNNKLTKLNLFFLKNFENTPQLNNFFLNLYSTNLSKTEKNDYITSFLNAINKIEQYLGPFPYNKLDVIFTDYLYASNSIIFLNSYDQSKIEEKIFDQYFKYYIYPKNNQDTFWVQSLKSYILDYLPLLNKSSLSASLYRKEILNSNSKLMTSSNLMKYSIKSEEQYKIQNYLFLLFTLEDLISQKELFKKIQNFIGLYNNNFVDGLDLFQHLYFDFNENLDFYFSERFKNNIEHPFIEIIESNDAISILQSEKVLPMLIPLKYHYNNSEIKDSLLFTKSFKTILLNKNNNDISKIEVDPGQRCLRKLHKTEIETKIKDLYRYNKIQIYISPKLKNIKDIKNELIEQLSSAEINFINYNDINSKIPSIIIGELPLEFKYLSTNSDLILNGRKFYLKNHCLAYTFNNQKNNTNLIIYSKSTEQIIPVIKKLKFFKNYSYFVLRNGNNTEKGNHETHSKQLIWKKK